MLLLVTILLAWSDAAGADEAGAPDSAEEFFAQKLRPYLEKNCVRCHGGEKPESDLALDTMPDLATAHKSRSEWVKVFDMLSVRGMPPADEEQPSAEETSAMASWIGEHLTKLECGGPRDPGRVTIRRLNRTEYNRTVRDLVGLDYEPAESFPSDDIAGGFDNISEAMSISPVLIEKYLTTAEEIADQSIVAAGSGSPSLAQQALLAGVTADNWRETLPKNLERFLRRAFRRPPTGEEMERMTAIVALPLENKEPLEEAARIALVATLVSPQFLFRAELDDRGAEISAEEDRRRARGEKREKKDKDKESDEPIQAEPIGEFELASRLSYFLWSSMPDDELLDLAAQGQLRAKLNEQVERMLADRKSSALVTDFAGQWLQLRGLEGATPDSTQFPGFDDQLRAAMRLETELFFERVLREDRSILELLDADYTFLNEKLARHYGIEGVAGDEFRLVPLSDRRRGGVLTQASVLTVTSNPTRTSPVKRGKWVLEQLLGTPPPPAPPNVPALEEKSRALTGTLRQRMEQHRANASCAACHERMDPLGFGLENFDAVGAWRDKDAEAPIDASGTLPDGRSFKGPAELRGVLVERKDEFCRCLTRKLLTYSLGRTLSELDECVVEDIARLTAEHDYRMKSLVKGIVASEPFGMRRVATADEPKERRGK